MIMANLLITVLVEGPYVDFGYAYVLERILTLKVLKRFDRWITATYSFAVLRTTLFMFVKSANSLF
jgi:hypothetical protein